MGFVAKLTLAGPLKTFIISANKWILLFLSLRTLAIPAVLKSIVTDLMLLIPGAEYPPNPPI
ncbi:hypothetical protein D3C78_1905900 [compost metagenome]